MNKTIKKIWNAVTTLLVAVVVVFALLLVGARVVGLQVFTVLSGSMEPAYRTGSLIYVKQVDYKQLQVGDVITFMLDEDTVATHRIIQVLVDEEDPDVIRYFTQGDANDAPDGSSVHYKNIIGSPVFTIPYLGFVANYIQNPPGMYVAISAGAVLLLLVFLPDLFDDEGDKTKDKKGKRGKTSDKADPDADSAELTEAAPQPAADEAQPADPAPAESAEEPAPQTEPAPAEAEAVPAAPQEQPAEEPKPSVLDSSDYSDDMLLSADFLKELDIDL